MSERIRSSNNETITTQLKTSTSESLPTSSDLQKQTSITNGESYTSNSNSNLLHASVASAATSSEHISTKITHSSASPKHEQPLDSVSSSTFGQVETAVTSSAPPLVAPPTSDVRDEATSPSLDIKPVDMEMDVKQAQSPAEAKVQNSDIPAMTNGSIDHVDDSSKPVAEAE